MAHRAPALALAVSLALAVLLAARQADAKRLQVFVFRHCVRSTPLSITCGDPGYTSYDNYTATHWDAWPEAPYQCTPVGRSIIENQGAALRGAPFSVDPSRLQLVVDNVTRDQDTAASFWAGLNRDHGGAGATAPPCARCNRTTPAYFSAPMAGICPYLTPAERTADLAASYAMYKPLPSFPRDLARLQEVLGDGAAPKMSAIPNEDDAGKPRLVNGHFGGGACVASKITETLLLQYASGYPMGGTNMTPPIDPLEMWSWMGTHVYYRTVDNKGLEHARRRSSNLVYHIMELLSQPADEDFTTMFVGHDSDLDALSALLGLTWDWNATELSYLQVNETTPGSALRFVVDTDTQKIDVTKVATDLGQRGPKLFETSAGVASADFAAFKSKALAAIDPQCVDKANNLTSCLQVCHANDPAIDNSSNDGISRAGIIGLSIAGGVLLAGACVILCLLWTDHRSASTSAKHRHQRLSTMHNAASASAYPNDETY